MGSRRRDVEFNKEVVVKKKLLARHIIHKERHITMTKHELNFIFIWKVTEERKKVVNKNKIKKESPLCVYMIF